MFYSTIICRAVVFYLHYYRMGYKYDIVAGIFENNAIMQWNKYADIDYQRRRYKYLTEKLPIDEFSIFGNYRPKPICVAFRRTDFPYEWFPILMLIRKYFEKRNNTISASDVLKFIHNNYTGAPRSFNNHKFSIVNGYHIFTPDLETMSVQDKRMCIRYQLRRDTINNYDFVGDRKILYTSCINSYDLEEITIYSYCYFNYANYFNDADYFDNSLNAAPAAEDADDYSYDRRNNDSDDDDSLVINVKDGKNIRTGRAVKPAAPAENIMKIITHVNKNFEKKNIIKLDCRIFITEHSNVITWNIGAFSESLKFKFEKDGRFYEIILPRKNNFEITRALMLCPKNTPKINSGLVFPSLIRFYPSGLIRLIILNLDMDPKNHPVYRVRMKEIISYHDLPDYKSPGSPSPENDFKTFMATPYEKLAEYITHLTNRHSTFYKNKYVIDLEKPRPRQIKWISSRRGRFSVRKESRKKGRRRKGYWHIQSPYKKRTPWKN